MGNRSENTLFRQLFQEQYDNLVEQIYQRQITLPVALNRIDEIQQDVQKQLDQLPSFDQNKYRERLQKLREIAQELKAPSKFQFKNKIPRVKSNIPIPDDTNGQIDRTFRPANPPRTCENYKVLTTKANATIRDRESSNFVYGIVEGAVYIDNVIDSHVYFEHAQQCRVHNSKNVEISLGECQSAILEESSNITFSTKNSNVKIFDFSSPDSRNFHIETVPATDLSYCVEPIAKKQD